MDQHHRVVEQLTKVEMVDLVLVAVVIVQEAEAEVQPMLVIADLMEELLEMAVKELHQQLLLHQLQELEEAEVADKVVVVLLVALADKVEAVMVHLEMVEMLELLTQVVVLEETIMEEMVVEAELLF